jgi:hypothetical protein
MGTEFKWDLVRPCKHCPFSTEETRIKFACRERAEEIEEIAYRQGFCCHKTGESVEHGDGESAIEPVDGESQHCAGALLMFLSEYEGGNVPFENLSDQERRDIEERLDWHSSFFESSEEFFEANERESA